MDVPEDYTAEAMADWHHQREDAQAREDLITSSIADVGRVEGFSMDAPGFLLNWPLLGAVFY